MTLRGSGPRLHRAMLARRTVGGASSPVAAGTGDPEGDVDDCDRQQQQANARILGADELRHAHISESCSASLRRSSLIPNSPTRSWVYTSFQLVQAWSVTWRGS